MIWREGDKTRHRRDQVQGDGLIQIQAKKKKERRKRGEIGRGER